MRRSPATPTPQRGLSAARAQGKARPLAKGRGAPSPAMESREGRTRLGAQDDAAATAAVGFPRPPPLHVGWRFAGCAASAGPAGSSSEATGLPSSSLPEMPIGLEEGDGGAPNYGEVIAAGTLEAIRDIVGTAVGRTDEAGFPLLQDQPEHAVSQGKGIPPSALLLGTSAPTMGIVFATKPTPPTCFSAKVAQCCP